MNLYLKTLAGLEGLAAAELEEAGGYKYSPWSAGHCF